MKHDNAHKTAAFPLTLILGSLVTIKHHWLNKMLNTNTTGSLRIIQQNGNKVFAVFMISLRDKKKTLRIQSPQLGFKSCTSKIGQS